MECILETVITPDGLPLDICQRMNEYDEGVFYPGLMLVRVAGGRITAPEAHALLKAINRQDVIDRYKIPAWL